MVHSYFCVTTNLSKGEPAAHCRGKLWRLVRASMTIVGLVPPVFYQVSVPEAPAKAPICNVQIQLYK